VDTRPNTPWLGEKFRSETRPVQSSEPTPMQVAQTVIAEMEDLGYMVSFWDGDDIRTDQALLILARAVADFPKKTNVYTIPDGPKMLKETLAVSQSAIGEMYRGKQTGKTRQMEHIERLQRLINECERKRPTGPDGKHGSRHTPECGCDFS
jgi:hypothetical protein